MASRPGDALFLSPPGKVYIARPGTPGERSLVYAVIFGGLWGAPGHTRHGALPNRIPEAAPYNVTEAESYPPPYEVKWTTLNHPRLCASCLPQIFQ